MSNGLDDSGLGADDSGWGGEDDSGWGLGGDSVDSADSAASAGTETYVFPELKIEFEYVIPTILKVFIPFPENYPNTRLKKLAIAKKENFGHVTIQFFTDGNCFVNTFYIITKNKYYSATEEEIQHGKGYGRKMLCFGIRELIKTGKTSMDKKIYLNALSDYDCKLDQRTFTIEHNQKFFEGYPEDIEYLKMYQEISYPFQLKDERKILEARCKLENNLKLSNYYEQYGFSRTKVSYMGIDMEANINDIFKYCESNKLGKKKSKRKSKPIKRKRISKRKNTKR